MARYDDMRVAELEDSLAGTSRKLNVIEAEFEALLEHLKLKAVFEPGHYIMRPVKQENKEWPS